MKNTFLLLLTILAFSTTSFSQDLSARDIIDKANQKQQGDYHQGEIKMLCEIAQPIFVYKV